MRQTATLSEQISDKDDIISQQQKAIQLLETELAALKVQRDEQVLQFTTQEKVTCRIEVKSPYPVLRSSPLE